MVNLIKTVEQASCLLADYWPLQSFIAMNALNNLTHKKFNDAVEYFSQFKPLQGYLPLAEYQALYQQSTIGKSDLDHAIAEYVKQLKAKGSAATKLTADIKKQLLAPPKAEPCIVEPAYRTLSQQADVLHDSELAERVHDDLLVFLPAYFDQGQLSWSMPDRNKGLFASWRTQAIHEWPKQRKWIAKLPTDPEKALGYLLAILEVPEDKEQHFLSAYLVDLLGWTSYIKWFKARKQGSQREIGPASLVDYLAVYLAVEWLVLEACPAVHQVTYASLRAPEHDSPADDNQADRQLQSIWQKAYEQAYRRQLHKHFRAVRHKTPKTRPAAQGVFCIDVRSEGLRRFLEAQGNYQTLGFAGFFGFAFSYIDGLHKDEAAQCPALLVPGITVKAVNKPTFNAGTLLMLIRDKLKGGLLAPFALFEVIGGWFLFKLIGKSIFPRLMYRFSRVRQAEITSQSDVPLLIEKSYDNPNGYTVAQLTEAAEAVLRTMGLTEHFARLVLICAHHSISTNNPYKSALDCGACGGHSGIINARVATYAFNHPKVRAALKKKDIDIPDDTLFIAGCHNTTTDAVLLMGVDDCPDSHQADIAQFQADLDAASKALCKRRYETLQGDRSALRRQANWAELAPELALINNAALIIGPRELTAGRDLQQRTFLHCYDYRQDPDGGLLAGVLGGPVMVAHWINMQYYLSTVDHEVFGSGNKAIQNVVGNVGIMLGSQSDLKLGLPQQSLFYRDERLHAPLRLLVVIYAPEAVVKKALAMCPQVQQRIDNHWIQLDVVFDGKR